MKNLQNNLYNEISKIIENARNQVRRNVNSTLVITYWQIGKLIVKDELNGNYRANYGKEILQNLSVQLTNNFGKGFDVTNLRKMKQFYASFPKQDSVSLELSWTHYRHLLRVEKESARFWYLQEAIKENWSTRALERQINSFYYERLLSSKIKEAVIKEAKEKTEKNNPKNILKDPYVLEFLQLENRPQYTENEMETALIDHLQKFLLELGRGFSFVGRQKHINLDGEHFYIDLVFYNFILKCFVLIDLKKGKLTHQDIGQMDTYIRIYEANVRAQDDNPTIGLILCSEKNEAVAKYSILAENKQLFASKYKLYLPTEKQLENELNKDRILIENEINKY
ncbi:MAG: PDDEXK nuclease domain-containing protein [Candidatus Cloacimonetes bacterium]|nr:PDDEXK nuclease domain-containing protein [Candidatus Cloacimonadota bacterium]